MDKISGVYKITNLTNGKYYIGSSSDISGSNDSRWETHKRHLKRGTHPNSHLQAAWNKYGESSFVLNVLELIPNNLLLQREQTYLDVCKQEKNRVYNTSFIADRVEMTEEVKRKIGISNTGKIRSQETKTRIRENHARLCGVNHPWFGKHHSQKSLVAMRDAKIGKTGLLASRYGIHHSEATKQLISERTRQTTPRGKNHPNYDVTIYTFRNVFTTEIFDGSQNEFYKKYRLNQSKVNRLVNKKKKIYKNWIVESSPNYPYTETMRNKILLKG